MADVDWRPSPDWERLFRGDRYRFEFGIRPAEGNWFQLARENTDVLAERARILAEHPARHAPWLPAADDVMSELLEGFPESSSWGSPTAGRSVAIRLASRWEPDFVLLRRGSDGRFHMVGGCVCDPSWWSPAEKLGLALTEIHSPVPTLNESLGAKIDTFLDRLPAGTTFTRENWGVAAVSDRNLHPELGRPRLTATMALPESWLRVEYQAFHALPKSQGILFGIWLEVYPLRIVLADPAIRRLFRGMLATMPVEIAGYKGLQDVSTPWIAWLDGKAHPGDS